MAVEKAKITAVEALIEEGAETDLEDAEGKTPLMLAQERGFEEIARLLGGKEGRTVKVEVNNEMTRIVPKAQGEISADRSAAALAKSRLSGKLLVSDLDRTTWLGSSLGIYKVNAFLGEGGYSITYLASFGNTGYAVKVLKVDEELSVLGNALRNFLDLNSLATNKPLVRPLAISVDLSALDDLRRGLKARFMAYPPFVVEELAEGGSLATLMGEPGLFGGEVWERAVVNGVRTAAEALSFLHSKGLVHTNVKPSSLLVRRKVRIENELERAEFALGDLMISVKVNSRPVVYNPEFYPPEAFVEGARPYSDVFALAVSLYVLLTGRNDRPDLENQLRAYECLTFNDFECVRAEVERAKRALSSWHVDLSPKLNDLLKAALSPDPLRRPTAKEFAEWLKRVAEGKA